MKLFLSILLLYLFQFIIFNLQCATAQNLVPNPSFEDMVQCPFSLDIDTYLSNWKAYRSSPDYFTSCATWWGAGVPINTYGNQAPENDSSYVGLMMYRADSSIYSEVIGVELNAPLVIGTEYYVSFKVNLASMNNFEANVAVNKMGVLFSSIEYSSSSNPSPITNYAHVYTDSVILDSTNWVEVTASFVADSAYLYLGLGNFFSKDQVDTINNISGLTPFGAMYYVDNVCVSSNLSDCGVVNVNNIRNHVLAAPYPNPSDGNIFISDPVQNIELYNVSGKKLKVELKGNYINISEYGKGIYFLVIHEADMASQHKIIIN